MSGTHRDRVALEVFQHLDALMQDSTAKRVLHIDRSHPDTEATIRHVVRWSKLRSVPIVRRQCVAGKLIITLAGGRS